MLASAGHGAVRVPLTTKNPDAKRQTVTVWNDTVTADDCGNEPAAWLSGFLGCPAGWCMRARPIPDLSPPASCLQAPTRRSRPSPRPSTPGRARSVFCRRLSVSRHFRGVAGRLNGRLATPLPMNRFRPSLVVAACLRPRLRPQLSRSSGFRAVGRTRQPQSRSIRAVARPIRKSNR